MKPKKFARRDGEYPEDQDPQADRVSIKWQDAETRQVITIERCESGMSVSPHVIAIYEPTIK